ncbi:DUF2157 domain-containing protein [Pontibacter sp. KCTC 32443]|uniref:DUF2157 domain-containing protein n=1 Tax=Pontibacter TaxID=323449 RepID=UPI00164D77C5|nr:MULTISPECIES: DUF2157 domain-containing protein [Pontibacter]MBC5774260.1 DUF2157 domain-containing protein [Pontibacter sp. KCTC 32443]
MKTSISRELIYSIARHSNWRGQSIAAWFRKEHIYADTSAWIRFMQLFLLVLGGGFLVAGIVFFFAYNWQEMHKFLKIGLVEVLLIAVAMLAVFTNWSKLVKNLLLIADVMLVGVLFAVYGQIYQTGANAYDFFLGWTIWVILWVLAARFQPLWVVFMALINTTFILYVEQVATGLAFPIELDILFGINATAVVVWEVLYSKGKISRFGKWFPRLATLAALVPVTMSMIIFMFDNYSSVDKGLCYALAAVAYTAGIWYGYRSRDLFYLSVIPFSLIVVGAAGIVRTQKDNPEMVFLFASLFVVASITLLVRFIIQTNRNWHATATEL